ncbi:hypothetical protein [Rhizobium leguminosarum]|uniref:hypothetical protein n=1 Tax=Rhizobium leguminosarum TaxID=384 RepID=UPI00038140DD|nr:hypothetical protein [Rhizobium leguminosarum]
MTWTNNNTCPVCEGTTKEALPKMGDTTEVICDTCGRYRITDSAKEEFRHKEQDERYAILERAKGIAATKGGMTAITTGL